MEAHSVMDVKSHAFITFRLVYPRSSVLACVCVFGMCLLEEKRW